MIRLRQLAAGIMILTMFGGCGMMNTNDASRTGAQRSTPTAIPRDNVPPIDNLVGDSPFLEVKYSDFKSTALPPEERYGRTADGKTIVKSGWGLYDPGFDFKEYMQGRDPHDARPYYEEFILDHLQRKYGVEFELGPKGHPMKSTSGGLYVLPPDGDEMQVHYSVQFTEDGKVALYTRESYVCYALSDAEEDRVFGMVMEELARLAPELEDPYFGFIALDSLLPQVFGAGTTYRDVNDYCLKYMGKGFSMTVAINYAYGVTPETEERWTDVALSIARMLEENNYSGTVYMGDYEPEDWVKVAAGFEFPPGRKPDHRRGIYVNFGYYYEYPGSHYSQKEIGWSN